MYVSFNSDFVLVSNFVPNKTNQLFEIFFPLLGNIQNNKSKTTNDKNATLGCVLDILKSVILSRSKRNANLSEVLIDLNRESLAWSKSLPKYAAHCETLYTSSCDQVLHVFCL